jgi:hypothetical protein
MIEACYIVLIIVLGVFLFLFQSVDSMCLELIRIGGGACNTLVGQEFGLIYMNPVALHSC